MHLTKSYQMMIWLRSWIQVMNGSVVGQEFFVVIFQERRSTSDLATEVAQRLLEKANLDAEEIDFIVVATITPDSLMPSTAARVQANIGASRAFAFDLTAACSGFVFALADC